MSTILPLLGLPLTTLIAIIMLILMILRLLIG